MTANVKPGDIDPESGCRLPFPKREDLGPEGREIYDYHVDPKAGSLAGLRGPGGVRLHSPRLSECLRPVGRYLRHEAGLDPKIRETAILITAREMNARFEWAAHEPEARRVGVADAVIEAIKHRKPLDGLPETEAAVIQLGREAMGAKRVTPATYARALAIFGAKGLVDVVSLMGNYTATATLLAVFDNQPDPGAPELPLP